jgi:hypothetical protein
VIVCVKVGLNWGPHSYGTVWNIIFWNSILTLLRGSCRHLEFTFRNSLVLDMASDGGSVVVGTNFNLLSSLKERK